MKSFLGILLLILAVSALPALAAESQYIIVVGADAPSTDVILGANFAASMKSTLGVTFSSAIDTDLHGSITDAALRSKTIVVIDGEERHVKILGTSNAAAAAQSYFSRQGFSTEMIGVPVRADVLVRADAERETPADDDPEEPEIREPPKSPEPVIGATDAAVSGSLQIKTSEPEPQQLPEPIPREQHVSVFARAWSWFAGLF